MPTLRLTKTAIGHLKPDEIDHVYWDHSLRDFRVKLTPEGREVLIVLYRSTDSRWAIRNCTLGPYGVFI